MDSVKCIGYYRHSPLNADCRYCKKSPWDHDYEIVLTPLTGGNVYESWSVRQILTWVRQGRINDLRACTLIDVPHRLQPEQAVDSGSCGSGHDVDSGPPFPTLSVTKVSATHLGETATMEVVADKDDEWQVNGIGTGLGGWRIVKGYDAAEAYLVGLARIKGEHAAAMNKAYVDAGNAVDKLASQ